MVKGQVVNQEALQLRGDPVGMKDKDVPFDRCPGHEKGDDDVDGAIDEHPNTAEGLSCQDWSAGAIEVNVPDDVGDLVS